MATKPSNANSSFTLTISEDAWQGNAQFVFLVDRTQVGDIQTATADHSTGSWQSFILNDPSTAYPSQVTVKFINDAWGGSAATDRNLYVGELLLNGTTYMGASAQNDDGGFTAGTAAALYTDGSIAFSTTPTVSPPIAPTVNTVELTVAEDAWQGDAQFVVSVDGSQVGGVQTATTSYLAGHWQAISLAGDFGADPSQVSVKFLNDAWGGSATMDRNLYVGAVTINGLIHLGNSAQDTAGSSVGTSAALYVNGSAAFDVAQPPDSVPTPAEAVSFGPNDYVSAGNVLQYGSGQSWSASAELRIDALPPASGPQLPEGGANLVFGNTNGAPYQGYEMWVDRDGHIRVRIMSNFLDDHYIDVAGTTNIVDGKWLSIGATYDGSSKASGVTLLVNGVPEHLQFLKDTLTGSSASNGPMIIGNQLNGWENQFELRGQMAAFAISNEVRPTTYFDPNNPTFAAADDHTQLAYQFAAGSGSMIRDLSGHANNGTLSNTSMWTSST